MDLAMPAAFDKVSMPALEAKFAAATMGSIVKTAAISCAW
jgi:hypothetical protein